MRKIDELNSRCGGTPNGSCFFFSVLQIYASVTRHGESTSSPRINWTGEEKRDRSSALGSRKYFAHAPRPEQQLLFVEGKAHGVPNWRGRRRSHPPSSYRLDWRPVSQALRYSEESSETFACFTSVNPNACSGAAGELD